MKIYQLLSEYKKNYLLEVQDDESFILYCADGKKLLITHGDEFGNILNTNKYDKCEYDEIIACYFTYNEEVFAIFDIFENVQEDLPNKNYLLVFPKSESVEIEGLFYPRNLSEIQEKLSLEL